MNAATTTHPIRTLNGLQDEAVGAAKKPFAASPTNGAHRTAPAATDSRAGALVLGPFAPLWQIDALKLRLLDIMTGGTGYGSGWGGFFAISHAPRQLRDRNADFSEKAETILRLTQTKQGEAPLS